MAKIVIENVCKKFGTFTAVKSSSFTVEDGEFFMLLGPSGCGKTTTLRMIAGLEFPTSGKIYIDDEEVGQKPASKRDIAFVFQLFALYPHMTVRQNIRYPLTNQKYSKAEITKKVAEVAKILDIENILDKSVDGLSGGDRQRVALGRAIVRKPKVFLMDEPLGALDAEFRERMAEELRSLHNSISATTIYVTHDQLEAMQMGDKILVMNHGVIEQFGAPQDIYNCPATMFVAEFIGSPSMNFLDFDGSINIGTTSVNLAGHIFNIPKQETISSGKLALGIRPEHILFSETSSYKGIVLAIEYLGINQIISVKTPNGNIKVRIPSSQKITINQSVGLDFDSNMITIFNKDDGLALVSGYNKKVLSNG